MYLNPLSKLMSFLRITDNIKPRPLSISKVVSLVVPFVNTHEQELKCKGRLHFFTLDTTQLTEQRCVLPSAAHKTKRLLLFFLVHQEESNRNESSDCSFSRVVSDGSVKTSLMLWGTEAGPSSRPLALMHSAAAGNTVVGDRYGLFNKLCLFFV